MKTVYFDMVGCRLNQAEIEAMSREFSSQGYQIVDHAENADLIVINTCCVTLKAAADSRKMLRHYQSHTNARVISTGCWNSAFPEQAYALLEKTDHIPNDQKDRLVELVTEIREPILQKQKLYLGHRQRTRGFVKVQDGCNNVCSYCLTQIARGASRSEHADKIIKTINLLVESGIKEVVLTGVQLGSWGKDLGELRIYNLVDIILAHTQIPRLRLSSIEPWDVSEELIKRFDNPRFCSHLHIPVQSGSDNVLRLMRRPLASRDLHVLLEMIRKYKPGIEVTTDIIVGFPGETQTNLQETLNLIESNQLSGGHVFKFSPMPGTAACTMPDHVQDSIKKERLNQVQLLMDQLSAEAMERKIGQVEDVLLEANRNGMFEGYTPGYFRVETSSSGDLTNTIQKIKLIKVLPDDKMAGNIV